MMEMMGNKVWWIDGHKIEEGIVQYKIEAFMVGQPYAYPSLKEIGKCFQNHDDAKRELAKRLIEVSIELLKATEGVEYLSDVKQERSDDE